MATSKRDPQQDDGPRTFYYGGDGPLDGDADFKAWQRRRYSVNRWDLLSWVFLVLSVFAGFGLWRLTGSVVLANVGFGLFLVLASAMAIRKWLWTIDGS